MSKYCNNNNDDDDEEKDVELYKSKYGQVVGAANNCRNVRHVERRMPL